MLTDEWTDKLMETCTAKSPMLKQVQQKRTLALCNKWFFKGTAQLSGGARSLTGRTYCNFVLRCAYRKGNFWWWTNACTNIMKWSLDISSLYLLALFFTYMCFKAKIVVEYMYCLPRLILNLWESGTLPCTSWFNFVYCCTCSRFNNLSRDMSKPTKWLCAQQRLGSAWAFAQSDQSSLSAWRKFGSLATH